MNDRFSAKNTRSLRSGDLDPSFVQSVLDNSRLQLAALLTEDQQANVAARFHPLFPVLMTGLYGAESHIDLWDLETRANNHSLSLLGTGHANEFTGQTLLGASRRGQEGVLPVRDLDISPQGTVAAVAAGLSVWMIDLGRTAQLMREGQELYGHQVGVHGVSFSQAGDLLASVDDDGHLVLWSTETFESVLHLEIPGAHFRAVTFSADDVLIAVADTVGNIAVWDLGTAERIAYFQAHQGEVGSLRFGPRGYILATSGFDGSIRLWDIEHTAPVGEPMFHGDSVYDVRFGTTEDVLYSCSFDKFLAVWDLNTQSLLDCYVSAEPILAMDLAPDDGVLAIVTAGGLELVSNGSAEVQHAPLQLGVPLDAFANQNPDASFNSIQAGAAFEAVAQRAPEPPQPIDPKSAIVSDGVDAAYVEARRIGAQSGLINLSSARMIGAESNSGKRYGPGAPSNREPSPVPDPSRPSSGLREVNYTDSIPPRDDLIVPTVGNEELPRRTMITGASPDGTLRRNFVPVHGPDASLRHPYTPVEVENVEKGDTRRYAIAIVIALVVGAAGAGLAYATRPLPEELPAFQTQVETIERDYKTSLEAESGRHQPASALLNSKLDKAKLAASGPNSANIIKGIERSIEQEEQLHLENLKNIEANKQTALDQARLAAAESPWSRVAMFGTIAFALAMALAFVGVRYAGRQ